MLTSFCIPRIKMIWSSPYKKSFRVSSFVQIVKFCTNRVKFCTNRTLLKNGVIFSKFSQLFQSYLFGEATIQGVAETAEQLAFGTNYRQLYADLIKTGSTNLLPIDQTGGQSNNIDISMSANPAENLVLPYAMTCGLFDMIDSYGKI